MRTFQKHLGRLLPLFLALSLFSCARSTTVKQVTREPELPPIEGELVVAMNFQNASQLLSQWGNVEPIDPEGGVYLVRSPHFG